MKKHGGKVEKAKPVIEQRQVSVGGDWFWELNRLIKWVDFRLRKVSMDVVRQIVSCIDMSTVLMMLTMTRSFKSLGIWKRQVDNNSPLTIRVHSINE